MPDRFYCPEPAREGRLTLEGDEARHLSRVRRLAVGARVEVFDGRGESALAEVVETGRDRVELVVLDAAAPDRQAAIELTLATAVPKGDRFDWLVEKATELGVSKLVPIVTERSVVDPRATKLDRLRRAIIEASKQCGRNRLMELDRLTSWVSFAAEPSHGPRLLAHPGGLPLRAWPSGRRGGEAVVVIGPEGGFSESEVEVARSAGWVAVGLGPTLLRIETAGLAVCSNLLALAESWEA